MHQGAARMARPGMNDEARRLVDHDQVLVFEDDHKVHRLALEPAWHHGRQLPAQPVTRTYPAAGAARAVVMPDVALIDQPLDAAPAELRQEPDQVLVEPGMVALDDQFGRRRQARRVWRFAKTVPISSTATPTVTAESATLKTGQRGTWMKSMTEPLSARS